MTMTRRPPSTFTVNVSPALFARASASVSHRAASLRPATIDDWAWRKGTRYGTILVDLEWRRVIDLLPDREPETVSAWLATHPTIEFISRDRASAYADAALRGVPQAIQIADAFTFCAT
jgi:transposase